MPVVDYGHGRKIQIEPGECVLDASRSHGLEHAHACDGDARCTTCRVRVEEGAEHCLPPDERELQALEAIGLGPPIRLACQLRPTGDIRVQVLIPGHWKPGGVDAAHEEQVAVLFSDIRGFTSFAEAHLPFDVCEVLNRYFDVMGVIVERNRGRIIDYLGDGLMTLFRTADSESPNRSAVTCGLEMRMAALRFGTYVRNHFGADLAIGVAVHSGPAVVGNLGYFRDRHLNAVGDVLNVVSRLEGLNKECGTDVLISDSVSGQCRDLVELGRSFELPLRGRVTSIRAHEVLGPRRQDGASTEHL